MPQRMIVDQMGERIAYPFPPQRIVSLVPSQTELLAFFGLNDQVVGTTKFCVHPLQWHQSKVRIGGTKTFDFDIIKSLQPDLIIGNKEENYLDGIRRLKETYPVWMSDIFTIGDSMEMIKSIGKITNKDEMATALVRTITDSFNNLGKPFRKKALYLIWKNPWIAVGRNTFINDVMEAIGLQNVVSQDRYPELKPGEMKDLNPDAVLLSSEPFPFSDKHRTEVQQIFPEAQIESVDGQMFSWYGSRLQYACDYFRTLPL